MLNYDYSKLKREEESSASSEYLHVRFLGHVIRLASLPSYAYPVTCLRIVRAVTLGRNRAKIGSVLGDTTGKV
jgi:hypothetical protein